MLLHNKKDFDTEQLLQTIFYTIASKHPDIILSNFNKNVFEKNDISTRLLFEGFKQIVSELTHRGIAASSLLARPTIFQLKTLQIITRIMNGFM